jgi:Fe2+ or Zn2+ uptake regulation protein
MTAFHAKFEQLQAETDQKLAKSQESLVQIVIEQVNHHMASTQDHLYRQLSAHFVPINRETTHFDVDTPDLH